jgi:hypothetical protein
MQDFLAQLVAFYTYYDTSRYSKNFRAVYYFGEYALVGVEKVFHSPYRFSTPAHPQIARVPHIAYHNTSR